MKDWQNLIAVAGILGMGWAIVTGNPVLIPHWFSTATLLGLGLIIGAPVTAFATGWAAQAQAKAQEKA